MINNDIIDSFSSGLSHTHTQAVLLLVLATATGVELGQRLGGNTLQHFLGENSQQLPANIERLKYRSVLVVALLVHKKRIPLVRANSRKRQVSYLSNKGLLKLVQKFKIQQVFSCEGLLTDNRLHGLHVFADGVASVQLVGHVGVVLSGHALTNGRLHETTQRGKHVDGWVHLPVVQLTIHVHLTLSNVTSKIRNGVSNIVIWHSKNRNLRNGAIATLHTTGSLVDSGQISVHVTGETSTAGNFLSSRRNLVMGRGVDS